MLGTTPARPRPAARWHTAPRSLIRANAGLAAVRKISPKSNNSQSGSVPTAGGDSKEQASTSRKDITFGPNDMFGNAWCPAGGRRATQNGHIDRLLDRQIAFHQSGPKSGADD
jgi:hypothetical protein